MQQTAMFWWKSKRPPYPPKKSVTFCWYLQFSRWKGEYCIQEIIKARLDALFTSFIDTVVSRGKETTLSELHTLCYAYYYCRLYPFWTKVNCLYAATVLRAPILVTACKPVYATAGPLFFFCIKFFP